MKSTSKKLDTQIFPKFRKLGVLALSNKYWQRRVEWEKQKDLFVNGKIECPNLKRAEYDSAKINRKIEKLKGLSSDIEKTKNSILIPAYLPKIEEKIKAWESLLAANHGQDEVVKEKSIDLYGEPQKDVFDYSINVVKADLRKSQKVGDSGEAWVAVKCSEVFSKFSTGASNSILRLPESVLVSKVRVEIDNTFGEILIPLDEPNRMYNAGEIKAFFDRALGVLEANDWQVEIREPSRGAISVSPAKKKVYIPAQRKLRQANINPLILHEIGTHLLRSRNGANSPLLLLGRGLDHYETAEEGIATVKEQAARGEVSDFEGMDGYLAVSLAYGLDGKKRNFRELYDILQPYLHWRFVCKGYQAAEAKSKNWAWYRCLRVFLGTSGQTPGACFTKDIIYRAGNIKIWGLVSKNPEEIKKFNLGKYDPTNQAHQSIIKKLGI